MAGTSRIGRRAGLRVSAPAGLAGVADVTVATPGPAEAVLAGVSKATGSPRVVIEAHVPGDQRVAHENEILGRAVVKSSQRHPTGHPRTSSRQPRNPCRYRRRTTDDTDGTGGISNSSSLSGRAPSEDRRDSTNYTQTITGEQ